ncbi:hypothetical protein HPP92_017069 [Vanilla planifolia]|uniref:Uncharacterized protein n=1 Tax=Vanilla planifolia TaxID=51239 RepID=A0A835QIR4_VANPL|nr:hypothetical protein HPP92_017069 [Vanilla planifolia]
MDEEEAEVIGESKDTDLMLGYIWQLMAGKRYQCLTDIHRKINQDSVQKMVLIQLLRNKRQNVAVEGQNETQKFQVELMQRLSKNKDTFGKDIEEVVSVAPRFLYHFIEDFQPP